MRFICNPNNEEKTKPNEAELRQTWLTADWLDLPCLARVNLLRGLYVGGRISCMCTGMWLAVMWLDTERTIM